MPPQNRILKEIPRIQKRSFHTLLTHVRIDLVLVFVNLRTVFSPRDGHAGRQRRPYKALYAIRFRGIDEVSALLFFARGVV